MAVLRQLRSYGLAAVMAVVALSTAAANVTPTEQQVKAVFLFNFSQFVDWPAAAFASPQAPFVIAVIERDDIAGELEGIARGEAVNGHPLQVRRLRSGEDPGAAHIVFAGDPHVLGPTLTVSDTERAAERGTMVQLARVNNRIRLRINVDAARSAGLTLSSGLLRPAEIVKGSAP